MSYTHNISHFATPATLALVTSLNNLMKNIHEDLSVTLVGGALRDYHYAVAFDVEANIKDFDFILTGPKDEYFDDIYQALKKHTTLNKFVDAYHSPRIARRGLSGVFKFNYLGCECDVLIYDGKKSISQCIREFDADVNQVALSRNFSTFDVFYTEEFKKAFVSGTYKLINREEVYHAFFCPEPKLQAREMKRLMNLQNKLPRFEMVDFPEFMERLDVVQQAEDNGVLDVKYACAPPQNITDDVPCTGIGRAAAIEREDHR